MRAHTHTYTHTHTHTHDVLIISTGPSHFLEGSTDDHSGPHSVLFCLKINSIAVLYGLLGILGENIAVLFLAPSPNEQVK